LVLNISLVIPI